MQPVSFGARIVITSITPTPKNQPVIEKPSGAFAPKQSAHPGLASWQKILYDITSIRFRKEKSLFNLEALNAPAVIKLVVDLVDKKKRARVNYEMDRSSSGDSTSCLYGPNVVSNSKKDSPPAKQRNRIVITTQGSGFKLQPWDKNIIRQIRKADPNCKIEIYPTPIQLPIFRRFTIGSRLAQSPKTLPVKNRSKA